jgi:hypothetical protein
MSNPPLEGDSSDATPGVTGRNTATTDQGFAIGVLGTSDKGEGMRGATNAPNHAAVAGFNTATAEGIAWGLYGSSQVGEGVRGETNSTSFAAVAGIELNSQSNIAAVYGEQRGGGPGVFGTSAVGPGVFGNSAGGQGVRGETTSPIHAAVAGFNNAPASGIASWGLYGSSQAGEGVRGETNSTSFAAVVGIELNSQSNIAAVYGEQRGGGPGVFGNAKGSGAGVFGTSATGPGIFARGNPAAHFEGRVTATEGFHVGGMDCAEKFEIIDADSCDAGTVMVINDTGALMASQKEYDRRVAGVVSGGGGLRPGLILGETPAANCLPVALIGTAFCKAVADNAPIAVGDLLTTSADLGCAMKASDPSRAFGAIIGKALQPLPSGAGLIRILIALQ